MIKNSETFKVPDSDSSTISGELDLAPDVDLAEQLFLVTLDFVCFEGGV